MPTSYTEDQARSRMWCPMATVSEGGTAMGGAAAVNRPENKTPRCWGSDCMFWQWDHDAQPDCAPPDMPPLPRRGYCGMAVR